jgi:type II secretory pathway pseudopilin PulG
MAAQRAFAEQQAQAQQQALAAQQAQALARQQAIEQQQAYAAQFPVAQWSTTAGAVVNPYSTNSLIDVRGLTLGELRTDPVTGQPFRVPLEQQVIQQQVDPVPGQVIGGLLQGLSNAIQNSHRRKR